MDINSKIQARLDVFNNAIAAVYSVPKYQLSREEYASVRELEMYCSALRWVLDELKNEEKT